MSDIILEQNWQLLQSEPGQFELHDLAQVAEADWLTTQAPMTVAGALVQLGHSLDDCEFIDGKEWWWQTRFELSQPEQMDLLLLNGLAGLCDVWLNGSLLLNSENMFISHQLTVAHLLSQNNLLQIRCRSLGIQLSTRHARPRWKTRLVSQQHLRWYRTSLYGYIPGWTPSAPAIGPWKSIVLQGPRKPKQIQQTAFLDGEQGVFQFACQLNADVPLKNAIMHIADQSFQCDMTKQDEHWHITLNATIKNIKPWWPHTHGEPNLYPAELCFKFEDAEQSHSLEAVGFRNLQVKTSNDSFQLEVNQRPIFCRGVCWTLNDAARLSGDPTKLAETLQLLKKSGTNMLRVIGTMAYESDEFYRLCSQLGIMVWQDFMFANMDYPFDDAVFNQSVTNEITQNLQRTAQHACVLIYCGNSEVEQQVAMLGLGDELLADSFYQKQLPQLVNTWHPQSVYIPSSPTGPGLAFHTRQSVSHYYGVGAYLRPVSEVRQHHVQFTSECLGFANIPVAETRNQVLAGDIPKIHDPRWKSRVPRDSGAGWDFEDVRDHYLEQLFAVDANALRYEDPDSYLKLSEVTSGEMMAQVMSEWRSTASDCQGALIWFAKDFLPGAGWGIIDSFGLPKASYYYLKRQWQPISLHFTDESINGLDLHLVNETDNAVDGELEIIILGQQQQLLVKHQKSLMLEANTTSSLSVEATMGHFFDITHNYRFGPRKHLLVYAKLTFQSHQIESYFILDHGRAISTLAQGEISGECIHTGDNQWQLTLNSDNWLYATCIECKGFLADDNFFHMLPGQSKIVTLSATDKAPEKPRIFISALNFAEGITLRGQKP